MGHLPLILGCQGTANLAVAPQPLVCGEGCGALVLRLQPRLPVPAAEWEREQ